MADIKFLKISWEDLEKNCLDLSQRLKDINIDKIVAISRGGLVWARVLSDLLNLPISHITIESYLDLTQEKEPVITEVPDREFHGENLLIIDEVCDSGKTFERAISYFKKYKTKKILTLAPYVKKRTKFMPNFYSKSSMTEWIIFPYEVRETYDAFAKLFNDVKKAKEKMLEVGFEKWEINDIS